MTRKTIVVMLVSIGVLLGVNGLVYAREFSSATTTIDAVILPVQEMAVIEPAVVSFSYPGADCGGEQQLVFDNVGSVLVKSNSDWTLTVGVLDNKGFDVLIKEAGDSQAEWIPVSELAAMYCGERGAKLLSWDVKIEGMPYTANRNNSTTIHFIFTMGTI